MGNPNSSDSVTKKCVRNFSEESFSKLIIWKTWNENGIIWVSKSRTVLLAWHVSRMREVLNAYRIVVESLKRPLWRLRRREHKMCSKEMSGGLLWTQLNDMSVTGGNASCVYIPAYDLHSVKPRPCLSRDLGEKIDTNLWASKVGPGYTPFLTSEALSIRRKHLSLLQIIVTALPTMMQIARMTYSVLKW
jgi:hypothetical protein